MVQFNNLERDVKIKTIWRKLADFEHCQAILSNLKTFRLLLSYLGCCIGLWRVYEQAVAIRAIKTDLQSFSAIWIY